MSTPSASTPPASTPPVTRAPVKPVSALRLGRLRIGVELKQFFRDKESAVFIFMLPVILLGVFGTVFGGQELGLPGVSFAQYFVAGMIASGIVYTAFSNLAIVIPIEREDGTLKRLQGTPMPKASYFVGKIGMIVVAYLAQLTLLVLVGMVFFDLTLPSTATQWWTLVWVSVLGLLACTLLGIAFSVVPKHARGASAIVTPIVLVLQFISGVFFVFSDLPSWLQHVAAVFPLKWLTQAMRSVFMPDAAAVVEVTGSWELGRSALVLGAWVVIGAVLALVFFRWTPRGSD